MSARGITFRGSPALVGAFAQMLREEGAAVAYEPPQEVRGLPDAIAGGAAVALIVRYASPLLDVRSTR